MSRTSYQMRLPPEVNRVLFVKNLPFKITSDELYDIFGKGNKQETKGRAYIVYEDIYDAKNAVDHLSGFNVRDRYIIVLYHKQHREEAATDLQKKQEDLNRLKAQHGVDDLD